VGPIPNPQSPIISRFNIIGETKNICINNLN
jgi:hypothetical protein